MRKLSFIAGALFVTALAAGCAAAGCVSSSSYLSRIETAMPSLAALPDGTYSGSASVAVPLGSIVMMPRAKAEVTVVGHAITAVKMTAPKAFPDGVQQFEDLAARVVATQSTDIDVVSGASFTSKAFLMAIDKALSQ
jgi:urocanate reductase